MTANNEVKKELSVANAAAKPSAVEATTQKLANALDLSGNAAASSAGSAKASTSGAAAKNVVKIEQPAKKQQTKKKAAAKPTAKAAATSPAKAAPATKTAASKKTDLNKQISEFAQSAYTNNTQLAKQLMAARNINEVFAIQSKAARENLQSSLQQALEVNKIIAEAVSQAFKFASLEK